LPLNPAPSATRARPSVSSRKHRKSNALLRAAEQIWDRGKAPDQITESVQAAYAQGQLPKRDEVSFGYMWSVDQNLGTGIGHWHPHMMVFAPYFENSMLGNNEFGSALPQLSDDAETPFAVVVIRVDDTLAIKARP
jgi:hypothetical protein